MPMVQGDMRAWETTTLEENHLADCRQLHERLVQIARTRSALDAREAELLLDADELQIWRVHGQPTLAAYLELTLGYGPHAANERLRVARELRELPLLRDALADGGLHFSAVRELTRVANRETEDAWIAAAEDKNLRQIERLVAGHVKGDLPSDPADPETMLERVTFELTPATIAAFRAMRKALDEECGERLTDDQVFQILARPSSGRATQVAYMVCPDCKSATADGAGMVADVTPAQLERALCDAEILGDADGEPAPVRKTVTDRLRRQVFARDHHRCTVPGCRSARNLDIHHVHYQVHGGLHEIWNLTVLCSGHHDLLHQGMLRISGKAPDLTYERRTEEDGWQLLN